MIIDASVAFKWIVEEEDSGKALALIGSAPLDAPAIVHAEVGNALWMRSLRGEMLLDEDASHYLAALAQIVEVRDEVPLIPRALGIAVELGHPIYDCIYLALAEQLDQVMVTADQRLLAKVAGTRFAERVQLL